MSRHKIEFLLCGSANDAFYSQAAMFRLFLDRHGGIYRDARLVMSLDCGELPPLPERWKPYLDRVEFHAAPVDRHVLINGEHVDFGDSRLHSYTLADDSADLSFVCDADTLLLRPFDPAFLDELISQQPMVAAVTGHTPPPLVDINGRPMADTDPVRFWQRLFQETLGRPAPLRLRYSLFDGDCPFYINYGLVATTPAIMHRLHAALVAVEARVRAVLDSMYYGQLAMAVAVESLDLPVRSLPMRFNFPNDPRAETRWPRELPEVHLLHYQRTVVFNRHHVFASAAAFAEFLALPLDGSDAFFRQAIVAATGGAYPFPEPVAIASGAGASASGRAEGREQVPHLEP
jgi:hypothetical protein